MSRIRILQKIKFGLLHLFLSAIIVIVLHSNTFCVVGLVDSPGNRTFWINLGQGTSATHGLFDLMCEARIPTCHFRRCCPTKVFSEQSALIQKIVESSRCMNDQNDVCSAKKWAKEFERSTLAMKKLVTSSHLSGIMDNPITGISRHLIRMIAPSKKIKFILTVRDKDEWARRRQEEGHNGLFCKFDTSIITGRVSNPLADHIECVEAAMKMMNDTSITLHDVFLTSRSMDRSKLASALEHYNTVYAYEVMSHYYRSIEDQLQIGVNFLHINFFNLSVNFQSMSDEDAFNAKVFEFLTDT